MARFTVIFKHGFSDDHVVVRVDGVAVFDRRGLTTRTTVDRAAAFDHDVAGDTADVEIELPERRLSASLTLDVAARSTLIVDLVGAGAAARVATRRVDGIAGDL